MRVGKRTIENFDRSFGEDIMSYVREDVRLMSLLRKILRETSPTMSLALAFQIGESIEDPDNFSYVQKSIDEIIYKMRLLFKSSHGFYVKKEISNGLGRMGLVLAQNMRDGFSLFYETLQDLIKSSSTPEFYFYALDHFLRSMPSYFTKNVFKDLKFELERAESHASLIPIINSLSLYSSRYRVTFGEHFRDIVDILIGWHIDVAQPPRLHFTISEALISWRYFWNYNYDFTTSLLQQFIEDLSELTNGILCAESSGEVEKCVKKGLSLLQIFNALVIPTDFTLASMEPATIFSFVNVALSASLNENVLINSQRIVQTLKHQRNFLSQYELNIFKLIEKFTLDNFDNLSYRGKEYSLIFIDNMFNSFNSFQQAGLSKLILSSNTIANIACSMDIRLKRAAYKLFSSLLNSRSVLILQDVHNYLNELLESGLDDKTGSYKQRNHLLLAVLGCFSNHIGTAVAIKSKWALDPIFTAIFNNISTMNDTYILNEPFKHRILLWILRLHCFQNKQFISTSRLKSVENETSPTSNFYSLIIQMLLTQLSYRQITKQTYKIILEWIQEMFWTNLSNPTEFLCLLGGILEFLSVHRDAFLLSRGFELVRFFMDHFYEYLGPYIYRIHKMAVLHLGNKDASPLCQNIISYLPPTIEKNKLIELPQIKFLKNNFLSDFEEKIGQNDFKYLFLSLYNNKDEGLRHAARHLMRNFSNHSGEAGSHIKEYAMDNLKIFNFWRSCELSFYALSNKLKTPLGKPQYIFATVEKQFVLQNTKLDKVLSHNIIEFYEVFERLLRFSWNGGSAFRKKTPPKPVLTFFCANKKTCTDWMKKTMPDRIRLAFKVNKFDFVIKQCTDALLSSRSGYNDEEIKLIVTLLALAFFKKEATDELMALHSWCKKNCSSCAVGVWALCELTLSKLEVPLNLCMSVREQDKMIVDNIYTSLHCGYRSLLADYYSKHSENEDYINYWDTLCHSFDQDFTQKPSSLVEGLPWVDRDSPSSVMILYVQADLIEIVRQKTNVSEAYDESFFVVKQKLKECFLSANDKLRILSEMEIETKHESEMVDFLFFVCRELENITDNKTKFLNLLLDWKDSVALKTLMCMRNWANFFIEQRKSYSKRIIDGPDNLLLKIAERARETKNYSLAKMALSRLITKSSTQDAFDYANAFDFKNSELSIASIPYFQELSKLAEVSESKELSVNILSKMVLNVMSKHGFENFEVAEVLSRLLHSLASIQVKVDNEEVFVKDTIEDILERSKHIKYPHICELIPCDQASKFDMTVGNMLRSSVNLSPHIPTYWEAFANWAFDIGEKAVRNHQKLYITSEEESLLMSYCSDPSLFEKVNELLLNPNLQTNKAIYASKVEYMKQQLRDICQLDDDAIEGIIKLWTNIQKRSYFFIEVSISSYFQQILLSNSKESVIPATLRILHVMVKYALELEDPLERGLSTTPCKQWQPIIPQLFSRLNHPIKLVRNKLIDMLSRLAKDNAKAVLYPAIVGSMTNQKLSQFIALNRECENQHANDDEVLQNAHMQIVNKLKKECKDYDVDQIQVFTIELQRISLLWDELWDGFFRQYSSDINQRIERLEPELKKLRNNPALSKEEIDRLVIEKHNITFKPIIFAMEKLISMASNPETSYESMFHKKYFIYAQNILNSLKNPTNPFCPSEQAVLLRQLRKKLSANLRKHRCLSIKGLSSVLSNFKNTKIPMPGISDQGNITISSLHGVLTTLASKTRPKKLWFIGNNGVHYGYLLKGIEDLHLDERIMQFLSIINGMIQPKGYKARTYGVVPLGVRSGLIQWVNKAVPVFALYKSWQQKQAQLNDKKPSITASDLFYTKLIPLLRERGITNLDDRKNWPDGVLKNVLMKLMSETTDDLIASEIYSATYCSRDWYNRTKSFSKSVAVMSVIGHIIGLGDRHLDNLLIDFSEGEIIHIDYNVCFDKGKNLRIPERVPFRLTQNFVKVFGATGVEGTYKVSCQDVMRTMRNECETLLYLLEAFVYDPLVDWTPGGDSIFMTNIHDKNSKKQLRIEIFFGMYGVRIAEIKTSWIDNKVQFTKCLSEIEEALEQWLEVNGNKNALNVELSDMHVCMSILKDVESNPRHKLYTYNHHYAKYKKAKENEALVNSKIENLFSVVEKQFNAVQKMIGIIGASSSIDKWKNGSALFLKPHTFSSFFEVEGDELKEIGSACISKLDTYNIELQNVIEFLCQYALMSSSFLNSIKKNHILTLSCSMMKSLSGDGLEGEYDIIKNSLSEFYDSNEEKNKVLERVAAHLKEWVTIMKEYRTSYEKELKVRCVAVNGESISWIDSLKKDNGLIFSLGEKIIKKYQTDASNYSFSCKLPIAKNYRRLGDTAVKCEVILDLYGSLLSFKEDSKGYKNIRQLFNMLNRIKDFCISNYLSAFFGGARTFSRESTIITDALKNLSFAIKDRISISQEVNCNKRLSTEEHDELAKIFNDFMESWSHKLFPKKTALQKSLHTITSFFSAIDKFNKEVLAFGDAELLTDINSFTIQSKIVLVNYFLNSCIKYGEAFNGEIDDVLTYEDVFFRLNSFVQIYFDSYLCSFMRKCMEDLMEDQSRLSEHNDALKKNSDHDILKPEESDKFNNFLIIYENYMTGHYNERFVEDWEINIKTCEQQLKSFEWLHLNHLKNISFSEKDLLYSCQKYNDTLSLNYTMCLNAIKDFEEWQKKCSGNISFKKQQNASFSSFCQSIEAVKSFSPVQKNISSTLHSLYYFESLRVRNSEESSKLKIRLYELLEDCKNVSKPKESSFGASDHELKLFTMNDPSDSINQEWITNTTSIIGNRVKSIQADLSQKQSTLSSCQGFLENSLSNFRDVFDKHCQLMTNAGVILQSLRDEDEYEIPQVKQYMEKYEEFLNAVSRVAEVKTVNEKSVSQIMRNVVALKNYVHNVYEDLISLTEDLKDDNIDLYRIKKHNNVFEEAPEEKKVEEEKNAFALNVLRRVRKKLKGKEADSFCQISVRDQVDSLIKEATSIDNLSLMYEGWTPWI